MSIRKASHAGSWYTNDPQELNADLEGFLNQATANYRPAKAIISPHAGYMYCGACGAFGYKNIDPKNIDKIFILGPSHHVRLSGCALSKQDLYETPLYNLQIDKQINQELLQTGKFEEMSLQVDEDEHSIEMQLPFVAKIMESKRGRFTIIPIMVGSTNTERDRLYADILAKYFKQSNTLFVISSDFCHWGDRFHYTHYDKTHGEIWQSIEYLDRTGMNIIEKQDPKEFKAYLNEFDNTICGRHPISLLLNILDKLKDTHKYSLKFVQYSQSSKCKKSRDSSVSYASASVIALNE